MLLTFLYLYYKTCALFELEKSNLKDHLSYKMIQPSQKMDVKSRLSFAKQVFAWWY